MEKDIIEAIYLVFNYRESFFIKFLNEFLVIEKIKLGILEKPSPAEFKIVARKHLVEMFNTSD